LALAIVGLAFLAQDVRREPAIALGVLAPLVVLGVYVGIYALTCVEARFGLPVFVLLAPAMARGLLALPEFGLQRREAVVLAIGTVVFVVACAWLSAWIQGQSPALHRANTFKQTGVVP
jgi:hypothetical protein